MSDRLTLKRFENLTLDDIYHPKLDFFVHIVLITITIINTVILPFMVYIIIKHSTKEMKQYKHLLIMQILFSYFFDLITFSWQPSLLWPLRQGFPNTFIRIGTITVYVFFILEVSFMFNIIIIQLYLVVYRLVATYKYTWIQYIYANIKILYLSFFITIAIVQVIAITPIVWDGAYPEEVRQLTASDLPVMAHLIKMQPLIAGYHPALSRGGIDFILFLAVGIVFFLPLFFVGLLLFFAYRLRYVKANFSNANYLLQKMLFKSLVVQIALLSIFLLLPAEIFVLTIYYEISWGSYAAAGCVVVCSFHMSFDCLALIYFIKPYRFAIRRKLRFFRQHSSSVSMLRRGTTDILAIPSINVKFYH